MMIVMTYYKFSRKIEKPGKLIYDDVYISYDKFSVNFSKKRDVAI